MSTSQTKWATLTKNAASAVPTTGQKKDRGTRYTGTIESVTPTVFKTGSFGLKFKYKIDQLERALYENVVLTLMNDDGMPTPTKYGEPTLKRRLQAAGMSADEINAFKIPKTVKGSEGIGLERLNGAAVAVYAIEGQYINASGQARPSFDVKSVFPLDAADGNNNSAA